MIVIRIKGGLGNQLFQYAFAYSLSKKFNKRLFLNPFFSGNMSKRNIGLFFLKLDSNEPISNSSLPLRVKLIRSKYFNKLFRYLNIKRHRCGLNFLYILETRQIYQNISYNFGQKNLYFDGYFQSPIYFKEFRNELLRQFRPNYNPEDSYLETLHKIIDSESVAIHIRRGDFAKDNDKYHYVLEESYYLDAISYIKKRVDRPFFFIFSNDVEWSKLLLGNLDNASFVTLNTVHCDIDELMLMKNCRHIIGANSTYSWWASWLNENENAIRIVPKKPFGMEGMIPNEWIKI